MLYEIWMEGYCATGDRSTAQCLGTQEAATFKEAVCLWQKNNPKKCSVQEAERMTIWGCRLFDNEVDARKGFG